MSKHWVTMTDRFMSGWGLADNKTNKLVIECDSYDEAEIVYNNALRRSEMKYINICMNRPRYNKNTTFESYKTKKDMPRWFIKGAF